METVKFTDLGNMSYQAAWDWQTSVHKGLVNNKLQHRDQPITSFSQVHELFFVEHPPVYTLGKSGSLDHLLLTESELTARGISYFAINRGGDITFHGPGQIVGYPILDLERFFTDVHRFVRNLEEVMIRTIADYGLDGFRIPDYTGVWVQGNPRGESSEFWQKKRKICAIGVHLSRWVTLHGWAFNVNTPLDYFNYIVPCGIVDDDKAVTSLATELGFMLDFEEVKDRVKRHFAAVFECIIA